MLRLYVIVLLATILVLHGCSSGPDSPVLIAPPPPEDEVEEPLAASEFFVVSAKADRSDGVAGTVFTLETVTAPADIVPVNTSWFVEDQVLEGEVVQVSFDTAGLKQVRVESTLDDGGVVSSDIVLVVHDPAQRVAAPLPFSSVQGDWDRDGALTVSDYLAILQREGGLVPASVADRQDADLDLDFQLSVADIDLLGQAVLTGEALPSAVLTEGPLHPGTIVRIISPALLDPSMDVTVRVNGGDPVPVNRMVLGHATLLIPQNTAPGDSSLEILLDGVPAQELPITIEALPSLGLTNPATIGRFVDEAKAILAEGEAALRSEYGDGAAVTGFAAMADDTIEALRELEALAASADGGLVADAMAQAMLANGLVPLLEQRAQDAVPADPLQVAAKLSPTEVCETVDDLCAIQRAAGWTATGLSVVSGVCTTVEGILLILPLGDTPAPGPADLAALAALRAVLPLCVKAQAGLAVAEALLATSERVDFELELTTSATADPTIFAVDPRVRLLGLDDLCQAELGSRADKIKEQLAEDIVESVTERLLRKPGVIKAIGDLLQLLGDDLYDWLEDLVESATQEALGDSAIAQQIAEYAAEVCDGFNALDGGAGAITVDANSVLRALGTDQGTYNFLPDGTAEFLCPVGVDSSGTFDLVAEKRVCSDRQTAMKQVQCGGTNVIITFGDDGSLNDDIFEVRVMGQVFTSNSPQRSITGEVLLPSGSMQEVQMLGRAAPDGVGTYFIRFDGATVIDGDATSGRDLTPGVTKRFIIQVN